MVLKRRQRATTLFGFLPATGHGEVFPQGKGQSFLLFKAVSDFDSTQAWCIRLVVQDAALSRRKLGFEPRTHYFPKSLFPESRNRLFAFIAVFPIYLPA